MTDKTFENLELTHITQHSKDVLNHWKGKLRLVVDRGKLGENKLKP